MDRSQRVVLAYSGGLDTVTILSWLLDRGWEVVAFIADVGQREDFAAVAEGARRAGAAKAVVADLRETFVTEFIFPAIAGNAVYENRYLLGTSLARPLIARRQVEVALAEGAGAVAHGATGKGNDQVRFELAYAALAPQLEVVSPWKDREFLARFKGRSDLLRFVAEHGLKVEATAEKPYSSDENLMHRSYEAGILEDPWSEPPADMFRLTRGLEDTPDTPSRIEIHFADAVPVRLVELDEGRVEERPLELFERLNDLGGMHGIGRVDMVENRFVGIKSRGVYETPGGTILHAALRDLEGIAMDREVLRLRDMLSPKFAQLIYNGFWFSPEMDFIRAAFAQSEKIIDGRVRLELFRGNARVTGRESLELALRPRAVVDGRRGRLRPDRRARLHPAQRGAADRPQADRRPRRRRGARGRGRRGRRRVSRLWERGTPLDAAVERFTVGDDPRLDLELVAHDALASCAHAVMLHEIGVLDAGELAGLRRELAAIAAAARAGRFAIAREEEDGHTAIENRLTAALGDAGRKIHTGRSRNDQVMAALRLWGREALAAAVAEVLAVAAALADLAEAHREVSLPGYTHTRQAMPSTLGFLFAAHAEGLADALPWLRAAFDHLDRSPLGSASGYGVPLPLDRERVAALLGFSAVQGNTLAVQNDRGRGEHLALVAVALPLSDLGRLSGDLILFSADELGFVRLAPEVTTGSSIMPQKRNPDVLELVRAAAARLRARAAEVAGVYGPLPSGYHRDLQLTKGPFLEGLRTALDAFAAFRAVLAGLEVDAARCRAAVLATTGATDEVYRRLAAGRPFREVYREVAADPAGSVEGDPAESWRRRTHLGAPGALDLGPCRAALAAGEAWLGPVRRRLGAAWELLGEA